MSNYDKRKSEIVLKWIKKAENDIKVAKYILQLEDLITDVACFHCQQAVEKYLKAFLTYHNQRVGKTHDIGRLLQMCIEIDKEFESMDREKIESLSIFAVEIRYPDDFYMPTIEELNEALEIALKVREIIFRKLKIKDL